MVRITRLRDKMPIVVILSCLRQEVPECRNSAGTLRPEAAIDNSFSRS